MKKLIAKSEGNIHFGDQDVDGRTSNSSHVIMCEDVDWIYVAQGIV